jgi:hypothetical protein
LGLESFLTTLLSILAPGYPASSRTVASAARSNASGKRWPLVPAVVVAGYARVLPARRLLGFPREPETRGGAAGVLGVGAREPVCLLDAAPATDDVALAQLDGGFNAWQERGLPVEDAPADLEVDRPPWPSGRSAGCLALDGSRNWV